MSAEIILLVLVLLACPVVMISFHRGRHREHGSATGELSLVELHRLRGRVEDEIAAREQERPVGTSSPRRNPRPSWPMSARAQERVTRADERPALFYDLWSAPMERLGLAGRRRRLLAHARARPLEAGAETARNLQLYPSDAESTGIDLEALEVRRDGIRRELVARPSDHGSEA
jgi:hypothetical protein